VSSSGGPTLEISNDNPTTVLSSITSFLSKGGSLGTLLSSFIFGILGSLTIGVGNIINAVVTFITTPFVEFADAVGSFASGLITSPLSILETTAQTSATSIAAQFGWLAFPVGVLVILGVLFAINSYREQQETGDTIPGLPFDVPDIGPFEIGTTEEGEDEQ
jgi:hypothetical protein